MLGCYLWHIPCQAARLLVLHQTNRVQQLEHESRVIGTAVHGCGSPVTELNTSMLALAFFDGHLPGCTGQCIPRPQRLEAGTSMKQAVQLLLRLAHHTA